MISHARGREPRADFHRTDMRKLEFEDGTFCGIWASFAFLHIKISDAKAVLSEFHRVLREEGKICLLLHTNAKTSFKMREISGLKNSKGTQLSTYVQEWNQDDLMELLGNSDFEIIKAEPFTRKGGSYPLLCVIGRKINSD